MSDNDSQADTETVVEVDVTSDDLADFEAEYYGTAEPEDKAVEEEEDVTDVATDADAEVDEEEDAEEEEQDDDPEPEPERKSNRKSAKERISELTAKVRDATAKAEAEAARVAALEARLAKLEQPKEEQEVKPVETAQDGLELPDPDEKDDKGELVYPLGQFDPKYNAEVVRRTLKYEREQAAAEAKVKADEEAKTAELTNLQTAWTGKLEATKEEIPDLLDKIAALEENFSGLEPTHGQFIAETIMTLSRGPEVLYYLADNISEAEAIVAMGPRAATIALGEIHGRLPSKAQSEASNKKVTTAPTPPVTTRGNSSTKNTVAPDTDSLEDFEREYFKPIRTR